MFRTTKSSFRHTELDNVTLTATYAGGIPVFFATYDRGVEWAWTPGLVLHMLADVFRGPATPLPGRPAAR